MKILFVTSALFLQLCLVGCEKKIESKVIPAEKNHAPTEQILKAPVQDKAIVTDIKKEAVKATAETEKKVSAEINDQPLADTIEHARQITQTQVSAPRQRAQKAEDEMMELNKQK